ncbi:MAG: tRNA uridine-5-carboxymethylaminomethyl(34) synthesis enzyme MnmG [Bacteroidia bacterium]|nr:tRNA uridine-5-carboxymethylaminomethyl(34) synthesis enzyme MnmG [Bacteroidia bacterium]MDW8056866.1 tRNA uridine-5-carboxymethylaminomethyl(34) synthesis enzyme MnmG [Bacteroidia bacterium]
MKHHGKDFDVIVVGAGHAGNEAAAAAAHLGCQVLLITMDMTKIGQMSCNPAMGGIAKGQLVREIDALGGLSGIVTDESMIQFRMLNRSKGPALWSPRAQNDRALFAARWRWHLEQIPNLFFWQDMVVGLLLSSDKKRVEGVVTRSGKTFTAEAVVLTTGTFLGGVIHIGLSQQAGGRIGEPPSYGITQQLRELGFETGRMKTGTPPRIDGRTIDYSRLEMQPGDEPPGRFSFEDTPPLQNQLPCWITYTNPKVHEILSRGFSESPLFTGVIQGIGPRYCPSIEDKIVRFSDRERHQLFIEPEGRNTVEVYLNGFSSSLPERIQAEALRHIPGLENARMFRPGYAIEYDFFPPYQLYHTLETRLIENLFFAGQINGTTGYEEAAAQGIIAGMNAAAKVKGLPPFILRREDAYIGVLIDDLVTKGVDEPYRMFTSRAEFRLLLRQDNADLRLTERSYQFGLASEKRYERMRQRRERIEGFLKYLSSAKVSPEEVNGLLESLGESPISQKISLSALLLRPRLSLDLLAKAIPGVREAMAQLDEADRLTAEIEVRYAGYIQKELQQAEKLRRLEEVPLPENFDFTKLPSLSYEAREKLMKYRPRTIRQASQISGVSPADIAALLTYLGR